MKSIQADTPRNPLTALPTPRRPRSTSSPARCCSSTGASASRISADQPAPPPGLAKYPRDTSNNAVAPSPFYSQPLEGFNGAGLYFRCSNWCLFLFIPSSLPPFTCPVVSQARPSRAAACHWFFVSEDLRDLCWVDPDRPHQGRSSSVDPSPEHPERGRHMDTSQRGSLLHTISFFIMSGTSLPRALKGGGDTRTPPPPLGPWIPHPWGGGGTLGGARV